MNSECDYYQCWNLLEVELPVYHLRNVKVGRRRHNKVRPILVKLHTVWGRQVILNGNRKLKEYHEMYVSSDEPNCTQTDFLFDRIKFKANKDGRRVIVEIDTFIIDSVAIFTVFSS